MKAEIVLATSSTHRKKILKRVNIPFRSHPPLVAERELEKSFAGPVGELSSHLSLKKAESLKKQFPGDILVGSDQVLIFDGRSFPKVESRKQAIERLKLLQGKTHLLSTSLSVLWDSSIYQKTVISEMSMHSLSGEEIISYLDSEEPFGSSGAYFFEERGAVLFREVKTSDPDSIVGFPLLSFVDWLRQNHWDKHDLC